jgi:hypothetical protein
MKFIKSPIDCEISLSILREAAISIFTDISHDSDGKDFLKGWLKKSKKKLADIDTFFSSNLEEYDLIEVSGHIKFIVQSMQVIEALIKCDTMIWSEIIPKAAFVDSKLRVMGYSLMATKSHTLS